MSKKFALNPGWALFFTFLLVDIISATAWLPAIFEKQPLAAAFVLWRIEDYASPEVIKAHYSKHVDDSDLLLLLLGTRFDKKVGPFYGSFYKVGTFW